MKKLTRTQLKNVMGGDVPPGGQSCNCLDGDPKGKCKTLSPCGICQCSSPNGSPAIYDLNDPSCSC